MEGHVESHDIEMEDIPNVFDTISGISNMRYFKSQELEVQHGVDEREI